MFECLIMGDSIAIGTKMYRPECVSIAKSGINSKSWVNAHITQTPFVAKTVIISLGSNDYKSINTEEELRTIRLMTKADRVYWILPAIKPDIQMVVKKVALEYNDIVIPITNLSADGVHPTGQGYKEIAEKTK